MLNKDTKQKIINKFSRGKGDTGSPEVQTGLLQQKIATVAAHLTKHAKDNHTRRGLIKMVAKRRRLLNYLKSKSAGRYSTLLKEVKL